MEILRSMESVNSVTKVVAAVIFDRKKESVLVSQRSKDNKHPLKWEFISAIHLNLSLEGAS